MQNCLRWFQSAVLLCLQRRIDSLHTYTCTYKPTYLYLHTRTHTHLYICIQVYTCISISKITLLFCSIRMVILNVTYDICVQVARRRLVEWDRWIPMAMILRFWSHGSVWFIRLKLIKKLEEKKSPLNSRADADTRSDTSISVVANAILECVTEATWEPRI